eukprot:s821_g24.t1
MALDMSGMNLVMNMNASKNHRRATVAIFSSDQKKQFSVFPLSMKRAPSRSQCLSSCLQCLWRGSMSVEAAVDPETDRWIASYFGFSYAVAKKKLVKFLRTPEDQKTPAWLEFEDFFFCLGSINPMLEYDDKPLKRSLTAVNDDGDTILHTAARRQNHWCTEKVVRFLLKNNINIAVNARNRRKWTPLHEAAWSCSFEVAELLVNAGADTNAKEKDGHTPLYWADTWDKPWSVCNDQRFTALLQPK